MANSVAKRMGKVKLDKIMRPERQAKIISLQIELLEELKTKIESVLEFTNIAIQKGNSWIKETNNEPFSEINKFLTDGILECERWCQDIIGNERNEEYHVHLEEQSTNDTKTKSTHTLKTTKPQQFDFREENEHKGYKRTQTDKTISKNFRKLKQRFEEHKNEIKEIVCLERKEMENEFKNKWNEIWEEFQQASNFMSDLKTENEDVNKQMVSLQEQIKEQEQKSKTFMEQQKSTENCFSLRLDEVMEQQTSTEYSFSLRLDEFITDILGNTESINKLKYDSETLSNVVNEQRKNFDKSSTNFNEKLNDLEENIKTKFKKTEVNKRTTLDENSLKSTELFDKIDNVSSQVDTMCKEFTLSKLSRQQAGFFASAAGDMNVQKDVCSGQTVFDFDYVYNNIGNHYDPTTGIFTAPCDGLYLFSLTLSFEIGENVEFCINKQSSKKREYVCSLQTTTINTSASVTGLANLKQNDMFYIISLGHYKRIKLNENSYFMCTLINKD